MNREFALGNGSLGVREGRRQGVLSMERSGVSGAHKADLVELRATQRELLAGGCLDLEAERSIELASANVFRQRPEPDGPEALALHSFSRVRPQSSTNATAPVCCAHVDRPDFSNVASGSLIARWAKRHPTEHLIGFCCNQQLRVSSDDAAMPHDFVLLNGERREVIGRNDLRVCKLPSTNMDLRDLVSIFDSGSADLHDDFSSCNSSSSRLNALDSQARRPPLATRRWKINSAVIRSRCAPPAFLKNVMSEGDRRPVTLPPTRS
jgi:hypothetical protein